MSEAEKLEDLAERARGGDTTALEEIVRIYHERLWKFFSSFPALSRSEVADLVQETLLRVVQNIKKLRQPEKFNAWLFTVAKNRYFSLVAGQQRERLAMERMLHLLRQEMSENAYIEKRQFIEHTAVSQTIESLADNSLREVGRRFYLEGEDASSIAAEMHVPISTVTTWLSRFRAKVRKRLLLRFMQLRSWY